MHAPSQIHMFAENCVIYHKITNPPDKTALQNDVIHVQEWCDLWLMKPNPMQTCLFSTPA